LRLTPTLEDNEQYEDRRHNYEADQNARRRCRGEDLIWHTRVKRQEYTSIRVHEHLTFMKHIYIDVNADVITVGPRFTQQE
jgi:hypothetical protein